MATPSYFLPGFDIGDVPMKPFGFPAIADDFPALDGQDSDCGQDSRGYGDVL